MIPLPRNISPDDIEQWFNRGIIMAEVDGRLVPCYYNGVRHRGDDEGTLFVSVETLQQGEEAHVPLDKVFGHWPRCGAVNCHDVSGGNIAVFVERTQRRQYRRTYNPRSLSVSVPDRTSVLRKAGDRAVAGVLTYDRYTAQVFNPVYYTVSQAEVMLRGTHASVALSPTTVITCGDGTNRRVYYNNELVAKYCPHGLVPLRARIPRAVSKRFGG